MVKKSTKKTLSDFIFKKCLPTQEHIIGGGGNIREPVPAQV